jgi:hypothetical protein
MATRYRKRGLDRTARRMVEFLELRGIEGATVLEIGGGVGEIQPRNAVSRLFISAENLAFRLLRREYRSFAHPPSAMLEACAAEAVVQFANQVNVARPCSTL